MHLKFRKERLGEEKYTHFFLIQFFYLIFLNVYIFYWLNFEYWCIELLIKLFHTRTFTVILHCLVIKKNLFFLTAQKCSILKM